MRGESRPGSARNPRSLLRTAVSLILLAAAGVFLWRVGSGTGWHRIGRALGGASPLWLLLAAGANLSRYVLWATRWMLLARPVAPASWWAAQKSLLSSLFVATVVPGARPVVGLLRGLTLARVSNGRAGPHVAAAVLDQAGQLGVSVLLGIVTIPAAALWDVERRLPAAAAAAVAAAAGVAVAMYAARSRGGALVELVRRKLPRTAATVGGALEASRALVGRPRSWAVMAVGGAAVWYANVLTYQLAGIAVGAEAGFVAAAGAFTLGTLVGGASGTPGGLGTTESAAVLPLIALRIPPEQAISMVIVARGVHYATVLVLGGIASISTGPTGLTRASRATDAAGTTGETGGRERRART